MRVLRPLLLVVGVTMGLQYDAASQEQLEIDKTQSVFAVVTQKAGIAAAMAHDHFITAGAYEAQLASTGEAAEALTFSFKCRVEDLQADDPDAKVRWAPQLKEARIKTTPFNELSAKDRNKIRASMLGADQLDAEQFPEIIAEVSEIIQGDGALRGKPYSHIAKLKLTIHGVTVERDVHAIIEKDGETIEIEAAQALKFSDFEIEPYSALLGAVRNKDEFFLYCRVVAKGSE